jgi:hypothetical protein
MLMTSSKTVKVKKRSRMVIITNLNTLFPICNVAGSATATHTTVLAILSVTDANAGGDGYGHVVNC